MDISSKEVLETIRMVEMESLDIRTITLGISLRDCAGPSGERTRQRIYDKITRVASRLIEVADSIERDYGIPVINKRISVTPIALVAEPCGENDLTPFAQTMDDAAGAVGVNFIGGFSAIVQKGFTPADKALINSIPSALACTERVCSSVNVASTREGINMDAIRLMGSIIKKTAEATADRDAIGCAKLVVFCNIPEDNPFMAGALHGIGQGDLTVNVGVSGPGVVLKAISGLGNAGFAELIEAIKRTAFKITRVGELVAREAAKRLGAEMGIVDLSLAPTPAVGDSVADIIEAMGIEKCGAPGTTAALAILNDAVKKGGCMATTYVGGLSGAFIPVSEDAGMSEAVAAGALTIEKLEAMTSVCSVGIDMVAIPGDTPETTIAGILADEIAVGVVNNKTTAIRLIPVPGKSAGDTVEFGGLFGKAPVLPVSTFGCSQFVSREGRIPAPLQGVRN